MTRWHAVVEALDRDGRGVAHVDGKVVFIEGALPGETVECTPTRMKATFAVARLEHAERESSMRVAPRCRFFGVCGGCSMQHLEPRAQVSAKQRVLEDALWHIGQVRPGAVLPPIHGPSWGYRHRARLSVRFVPKKGGVLVGFHERRSSYVADMTSCEVLPTALAALLVPLRALVQEMTIRDRMPQIEVAVGDRVTVLVFRNLEPLAPEDEAALRTFADRHLVQIWLQPKGPESARPFHPIDAPALDYALPEFAVRIGFLPTDFTQVNHAVNSVLVRRAIGLLAPAPGEHIADLFCGLGNFTLPIARAGAEVIGLEGNPGLVERARRNAAANGLSIKFEAADLFEVVPDLAGFDKLLIDPPRDGAVEVVKRIDSERAPRRIVYVSCDPATLARDAGILVNVKGYVLEVAGVVNMFPHTSHVESIALFTK